MFTIGLKSKFDKKRKTPHQKLGVGVVNGEPYPGGLVFANHGQAVSYLRRHKLPRDVYGVYEVDTTGANTHVVSGQLRLLADSNIVGTSR